MKASEETPDTNPRNKWYKLEVISKIVAGIAIPVALGVLGYSINVSLKEHEARLHISERIVGFAFDIISDSRVDPDKMTDSQRQLQQWALDVVNRFSPINLPQQVQEFIRLDPRLHRSFHLRALYAGSDVEALADRFDLTGSPADPNASSWEDSELQDGRLSTLAGKWSSRWNNRAEPGRWHQGAATILAQKEYFVLLHTDDEFEFLMIGKQTDRGLLIGRHYNVKEGNESSPWVGLVVDASRIDGEWRNGRWDLRRFPGRSGN